jgi:DNA polymerase-3 subunit alpha
MKTHSHFSLKYGILSPEEIVSWAIEAKYAFVFLADIHSTGAAMAFLREAKRKAIQGVVGVELRNGLQLKCTIIARNNRGFHELNVFLSHYLHKAQPFPDIFPHFGSCYIVYPIDAVPKKLKENEYIQVTVSDVMNLDFKYQKLNRSKLIALTPMIFRSKRDFNTHRLLRAIHYNSLLSKLEPTQQADEKDQFLNFEDWKQCYAHFPELVDRTIQLFQSCHVDFKFGDDATPQNPVTFTGSKEEDEKLLRELCMEGLSYRYKAINPVIQARIDKEIEIIAQKDYLSYFLITWDFTSYARSKGYFYVGRGSGANSLVAYLLRITDVDPLELDLYFERFINL